MWSIDEDVPTDKLRLPANIQQQSWIVAHEFGHLVYNNASIPDETRRKLIAADWSFFITGYAENLGGLEQVIELITATIWNAGHSDIRGYDESADGRIHAIFRDDGGINIYAQPVVVDRSEQGLEPCRRQLPLNFNVQVEDVIRGCVFGVGDCSLDWVFEYEGDKFALDICP